MKKRYTEEQIIIAIKLKGLLLKIKVLAVSIAKKTCS